MAIIQGDVIGGSAGFYPKEIEQSLRFNDNDSAYLSWTPASAGNRKTWTFSTWVKRGNIGTGAEQFLLSARPTSTPYGQFYFSTTDFLWIEDIAGVDLRTSQVFRDVSSWYHIVLVADTSNATSSERIKLYVNGERVVSFTTATYPAQNADTTFNSAIAHGIGVMLYNTTNSNLDGYLAETHFTDGTAYDATAFGEFKNGVWVAKEFTGTYGTNGFYLDFADGGAIGNDVSGNNNDWTATNLASTDVMLDSPTNNFATWNATAMSPNGRLQQGNLQFNNSTTSWQSHVPSSIGISSGKYYAEFLVQAEDANQYNQIAVSQYSYYTGSTPYSDVIATYQSDGRVWTGSVNSGHTNYGAGDIVGVQINADDKEILFNVNGGSWFGATAGSGTPISYTENTVYFANFIYTAGQMTANFGQDSSFAGNKVPQGYTDANGRGDFYYAPPAGYLALCTANLPEPAIGPNSDSTSDEHFNTVLWTGNGSTQSITGVGFQPDFLWIKNRSTASGHYLGDAVRGAGYQLISNNTDSEHYQRKNGYVTSYDSDGYSVTVGSSGGAEVNASSDAFVSWNWKANGSGVSNTDGSITSTVSANVDAGFSIVTFSQSSSGTIGHGLSSAPELIVMKDRDSTSDWQVYSSVIGASNKLLLNSTSASVSSGVWSNTAPTSSVFSSAFNAGSTVAYAFHSVEGFSKFGSYTGNGSTDGPFVHCGFRPAFVMCKVASGATGGWNMFDNTRDPYNEVNGAMVANLSNAEDLSTAQNDLDFCSNGFKIRESNNNFNGSGHTFIYMAFAENPFKYSNAR